jgi:hypothetical protein
MRFAFRVHVSQVAFDRFLVELPEPEPGYTPLADLEEVGHLVRFLWQYDTPPLLALVGGDASWCQPWSPRRVCWVPEDADSGEPEIAWHPDGGGHAVVLDSEDELRRFLAACPAISRVALLWPRVNVPKALVALAESRDWRPAADAVARFAHQGALVRVQQLQ